MKKNIGKIKLKRLQLIIGITITIILTGTLIYFCNRNKTTKTVVQPASEEEFEIENQSEENENSNEELQENEIDENTVINEDENNIADKNTDNNSNNANSKNSTTPYYIKVNYGAQVVTIYGKDSNGNYTVPVKAMICSTGTATPRSGVYSIPGRWTWGALFGNVYGQYCVKITGNILFHSVPYLRKGDNASLEYLEYDKLGTAASAGCVRLTVSDLIWLYNNCANGTKVEFYSSSDPGPLGKPSAKKISSYPDYLRNWDPTDPNPNNPWKTYKETENANKNANKNDNKQNNSVKNEITNSTKPDNSVKSEETNNIKPDNSAKNEITNSTKPDSSAKNEITNSTKPDNSIKNEIKNNTKPNSSVKNKVINNSVQNITESNNTNNKVTV